MDYLPQRSEEALTKQATTARKGRARPANLREQVNPEAVAIYEQQKWATPRTTDDAGGTRTLNDKGQRISKSDPTKTYGANLSDQVKKWPTPTTSDQYTASCPKKLSENGRNPMTNQLRDAVRCVEEGQKWLTPVVQDSKHSGFNTGPNGKRDLLVNQVNWPTPNSRDHKGGSGTIVEEDGKFYRVSNTTQTRFGARLDAVVEHLEKWPTPAARDYKGGRNPETLKAVGITPTNSLNDKVNHCEGKVGHLNPTWVEALMGVPPGWTALDGTNDDWFYGWHDGSWEEGIPRVVESCDDRVDRIRLLGNGVVPATAAKAWITLVNQRGNSNAATHEQRSS
jgi:hypothetical protein